MKSLDNYLELLARVDDLCSKTVSEFASHVTCRQGCDSCCRHLTLSRVEGAALAVAMAELPEEEAEHLRQRAALATADSPCPLLEHGSCLLYRARPIICRTHGLPLLIKRDGTPQVDFCPLNFQGVQTLPGRAIIDLDRLNTALAAINSLFIREAGLDGSEAAERHTIAAVLLSKI
jgi:Fe-S-cluster containining protein